MSTTTRNPTVVANCGCPYDPEHDEGSLGWHLVANHPEMGFKPVPTPFGAIRQPTAEECELVGRDSSYSQPFVPETDGDYLAIGDDVHVIPAGIYIEE